MDNGNIEEFFPNEGKKNKLKDKSKKNENMMLSTYNIWGSIGLYSVIAVPFFFSLIKYLENKEKSNTTLTLDKKRRSKNDTIVNFQNNPKPIVLNEVKKFNLESDRNKTEFEIEKKIVNKINDSINNSIDSTNYALIDLIESDTLLTPTQINPSEEGKTTLTKANKVKEPIVFYRDRIVLQEKINHVSFFFIEYVNDRMVFERNGHKIYLNRKDGGVKVSTNSDKIKAELLNLVYINRNKIFDYYSKLN